MTCDTFIVSASRPAHCGCFFLCQPLYFVCKASFSVRYALGDLLPQLSSFRVFLYANGVALKCVSLNQLSECFANIFQ